MKSDKHDREDAARERRRQRLADLVPPADPVFAPAAKNEPLLDEPSAEGVPKFLLDSWRKMDGR